MENTIWKNIYYLRLECKILQHITGLDFYQGVYWNALLREWLKPYTSLPLENVGIVPIPCQNGFRNVFPNDVLYLDLIVPEQSLELILNIRTDIENSVFPDTFPSYAHFCPGKTIKPLALTCLKTNSQNPNEWHPINWKDICLEAESLVQASVLTLAFHTPLRHKRPMGEKEIGHRFMDAYYFDISYLLQELEIKLMNEPISGEFICPEVIQQNFLWVDVHYSKTLGGIMGAITLVGNLRIDILRLIVAGQYLGLGKNNSFGFGFYRIVQSPGFVNTPLPDNGLSHQVTELQRGIYPGICLHSKPEAQ